MIFKYKSFFIIFLFSLNLIFGQDNQVPELNKNQINFFLQKADSCKSELDFSNASKYIVKVLDYYQLSKDLDGVIFCKVKLAEINRHAALYENAFDYLVEVENLIKKSKNNVNPSTLMFYYNRKASLSTEYFSTPDSTLYYSNKALKIAEKIKDFEIQLLSLMEIGYAYENQTKYDLALFYYNKGISIIDSITNQQIKCDAYINLARVYSKSRQYKQAVKICEDDLAPLKKYLSIVQQLLVLDIKIVAYEQTGNVAKAYENLKLRLQLNDLYYKQVEKDKLQEISDKFRLQEKNVEIGRSREKIVRARNNQLLLFVIVLLFLLGILSLIYYSNKISKKNKQLNVLSENNAFLLREANHRINNNLQLIVILISEELEKLNDNESLSVKKILSKVESIATLHRHLYQKENKNEIELYHYLKEIKQYFDELFDEKKVQTQFEIQEHVVTIDHGMYLGLLLTELFINSLKYAFKEQEERIIKLQLKTTSKGYYFEYYDNGQESIGRTIKPKLIDKLCKQLQVNYKIQTDKGFCFSFEKVNTNE